MRATVEQVFADRNNAFSATAEWLKSASITELSDFLHLIGFRDNWTARAESILRTRISDQQIQAASTLAGLMTELVSVATEQKRLAEKLDGQTDRLIRLTVWLKGLTIALVILTLVLCFLEVHR